MHSLNWLNFFWHSQFRFKYTTCVPLDGYTYLIIWSSMSHASVYLLFPWNKIIHKQSSKPKSTKNMFPRLGGAHKQFVFCCILRPLILQGSKILDSSVVYGHLFIIYHLWPYFHFLLEVFFLCWCSIFSYGVSKVWLGKLVGGLVHSNTYALKSHTGVFMWYIRWFNFLGHQLVAKDKSTDNHSCIFPIVRSLHFSCLGCSGDIMALKSVVE